MAIPAPVEELIKAYNPSDRKLVGRVFALLEDDPWRDAHKIDFGIICGEQTWAIADQRVTVTFIENDDDDTVVVTFVNMRSRFHPSWA